MNIEELKSLRLTVGEIADVELIEGSYEKDGKVTEGLPSMYRVLVASRWRFIYPPRNMVTR